MPEPCFPEGDSRLHRGYYLGFAAVAVLGFIVPAFSRALWNPDEPRVASIGSAMARPGGDLLVPRLNGEPFLQEPPLFHWLTALAFRLFDAGPGRDWVPRLPSMAFAMGTFLLLWWRGGALLGRRGGLLASLFLAGTAEYLEIANRAGPDGALTFFTSFGALEVLAMARDLRLTARRALAVGLAAGFAFLTKNLLGPAYLFLILSAVLLRRPGLLAAPAAWGNAALGGLAFAAVTAPWVAALIVRDPSLSMARAVLIENTVGRFASEGRHDTPLLEFSARLLADALPWTPLYLLSLWSLVRTALGRRGREATPGPRTPGRALARPEAWTLLAWISLPAILVLASRSKRDLYLLPVFPALALALAALLEGALEKPPWPARWLTRLLARPGSGRNAALGAALVLALLMAGGNLIRYRVLDPGRSYAPLGLALSRLHREGGKIAGYKLGIREVSAVTYYLQDRIGALADPSEAEGLLSGTQPAAVVVPRSVLETELPDAARNAPARLSADAGRGVEALLNFRLP